MGTLGTLMVSKKSTSTHCGWEMGVAQNDLTSKIGWLWMAELTDWRILWVPSNRWQERSGGPRILGVEAAGVVEDVGSSRKFCTVTENPSRILTLCILCWNCIRGDANVLAKLIVSYAQYISIFFWSTTGSWYDMFHICFSRHSRHSIPAQCQVRAWRIFGRGTMSSRAAMLPVAAAARADEGTGPTQRDNGSAVGRWISMDFVASFHRNFTIFTVESQYCWKS